MERDQSAVRLVFSQDQTAGNPEVVNALREMLALAQKGALVGMVCATMYSAHSYKVHTLGDARRNPTFSRGMVRSIDDRLAELLCTRG